MSTKETKDTSKKPVKKAVTAAARAAASQRDAAIYAELRAAAQCHGGGRYLQG